MTRRGGDAAATRRDATRCRARAPPARRGAVRCARASQVPLSAAWPDLTPRAIARVHASARKGKTHFVQKEKKSKPSKKTNIEQQRSQHTAGALGSATKAGSGRLRVRFGNWYFPVRHGSACAFRMCRSSLRVGWVRFHVRFRVRFRPVPESNGSARPVRFSSISYSFLINR